MTQPILTRVPAQCCRILYCIQTSCFCNHAATPMRRHCAPADLDGRLRLRSAHLRDHGRAVLRPEAPAGLEQPRFGVALPLFLNGPKGLGHARHADLAMRLLVERRGDGPVQPSGDEVLRGGAWSLKWWNFPLCSGGLTQGPEGKLPSCAQKAYIRGSGHFSNQLRRGRSCQTGSRSCLRRTRGS